MFKWFNRSNKQNEGELNAIVEDVSKMIDKMYDENTSKIRLTDSMVDKYGTNTIKLSGGLNGWGEWDVYFKDLSKIVKKVKTKYDMWLISLENDCPDDLFYATFGIDKKQEG